MLEFEFEVYDINWVRVLPPCPLELAAEEVCPDAAGQAADGVHRRRKLSLQ
jgi:hypothetical protein